MLPRSRCSILAALGWGHGDEKSISREQAIEWFDVDHVGVNRPIPVRLQETGKSQGPLFRQDDDERVAELLILACPSRSPTATC
jgi:glutamyl-tRNA synthetase